MRPYVAVVAALLALVACRKKEAPPAPVPAAATNAAPVAVVPKAPILVTFRPDTATPLGQRFAADDTPDVRYGPGRQYPEVPDAVLERGQRIYVMDETNVWIRIRTTEEPAPALGWINKFASLPALDSTTNLGVHEADLDLLRTIGLLAEVNAERNEAMVNTNVWNAQSMAVRRGVGRTLAFYCGLKKGSNTRWVQINDSGNGARLARYSDNTGYTDFRSFHGSRSR